MLQKDALSRKNLVFNRKYPFRGYYLGVLTHITAWNGNWGGDYTLKRVLVNISKKLFLVTLCDATAGNGANFWTNAQTRTDKWTN